LLLSLAAEVAGAGDVVAASWRCCWRWRPMLLSLAADVVGAICEGSNDSSHSLY